MTRKVLALTTLAYFFGTAFSGQTASSARRPRDTIAAHIQKVESCLPSPVEVRGEPAPCQSLKNRMAELRVPAVSIAVVHRGAIEWAKGYGFKQLGGETVVPETLFQAGSISKPVAALGALHLVQEGKLSLDSDVNAKLTSWSVPPSHAAGDHPVTMRELLTHTAGMTVHGFPGYAKNAPVPTLVQVLNGTPPANTPPIRVESVPGSKWNYSGGGFTVMQQLVVDVTKESFSQFLYDTVLQPVGMFRSTYQQPLPADLLQFAALPYLANGDPVPGGPHTYPEMAAAGLWTTPSDLARYIIEVERSLRGKANHVLTQTMTKQMLTVGKGGWGLGLQIGGAPSNPYFEHGGVNEGYESLFVGYENSGNGAVVMTNAEGGTRLADQVMSSIAIAYGWPDFRPALRTEIKVDRALLARCVGTYELSPNFNIVFSLDGDQLMTQATGQSKVPIYPESDTKFFLKVVDAEVEFLTDAKGQITGLVLHQNGHKTKGVKK